MALVGNLITKLGLDSSEFNRGMQKARKQSEQFGRSTKAVSHKLDKFAQVGLKAAAAIGAAFVSAGIAAARAADDYEKSYIVFGKLLGSMEAGEAMLKRLDKFSIATPFQPKEVEEAAQTLLGFGLEASKVIDTLGMLGDISKGNGQVFQDLARVYGEARAEGKLMSKDIRQFVAAGVPITKLLAEQMGVLENQIFDMASEGKISFSVLEGAFNKATDEGGMFHEMMLAQSQTLGGLVSTMQGKFNVVMRELGATLLPAAKVAAKLVNEQLDILLEHITGFNREGVADTFIGSVYAISESFGLLFKNIQRGSGLIRGVVKFMSGDLKGAGKAFEQWAEGIENVFTGGILDEWAGVKNAFYNGVNSRAEQWDPFGFMNVENTTGWGPLKLDPLPPKVKPSGGNSKKKKKGKEFSFDTWLVRFTNDVVPVFDEWLKEKKEEAQELLDTFNKAADATRDNEKPIMPGIGGDEEPTNLEKGLEFFGSESEGLGILGKIKLAKQSVEDFGLSWGQIAENFPEFANQIKSAASTLADSFINVFEKIIRGGFKFGKFMKEMLMMVIKRAIRALVIFAALSVITGGTSGVASFLGIEGKASFGKIFAKLMTGFAKGGIVNKPTMGLVGEYPSAPTDPEVIGRASTIAKVVKGFMGSGGGGQQLVAKVQGKDLILMLREASFDNGANGGPQLVFN